MEAMEMCGTASQKGEFLWTATKTLVSKENSDVKTFKTEQLSLSRYQTSDRRKRIKTAQLCADKINQSIHKREVKRYNLYISVQLKSCGV